MGGVNRKPKFIAWVIGNARVSLLKPQLLRKENTGEREMIDYLCFRYLELYVLMKISVEANQKAGSDFPGLK